MTVLILPWEKRLNFGHGKLRKVMEKVMESHGILKVSKSTNPVFLFSTAVARTTLPWSIGLLFLFDDIFYIHPIGHVWVAFWPLRQNESKCKTIHMISAYRFINWFLCEIFCTKTRLKTEEKGNIHPWAAHRSLWFCFCLFFIYLLFIANDTYRQYYITWLFELRHYRYI